MNAIKQKREAARLTQSDMALKLSVDRSTVAKWETGEAFPRADKLPQLAEIFGCKIDDLFKSDKSS